MAFSAFTAFSHCRNSFHLASDALNLQYPCSMLRILIFLAVYWVIAIMIVLIRLSLVFPALAALVVAALLIALHPPLHCKTGNR
jgi:uncharacterized membrane protein